VIHQENRGLSAARNAGLCCANGEFILFVDSDDWLGQRLVSGCIDAARQYHAGVVGYKYQIVGRQVRSEKQSEHNAFDGTQLFEGDQALEASLDLRVDDFAWAYMVRRRILDENRIQFPVGRTMEDVATTYRIFAGARRMVRLPNVYYFYRRREGSILDKQSVDMVGDYVKAESEIVHFSMTYPLYIRESALRRLVKTLWWCNRTAAQRRYGSSDKGGGIFMQIDLLMDSFRERIDHVNNLTRKEYIQYHLMRTPRIRRFTRQLLALLTVVHLIKTN
jgi:glycosyltransferase involved in cell wall biosynthesis